VKVRQEELRWEYGEALHLLARLLFTRERHAEAAETYRKAIVLDGLLKEAHRGLMRCRSALGERGQAFRRYEELVALLDEQLAQPRPPRPEPSTNACAPAKKFRAIS
jgi:tetratricopeptide (TPR) repeat protein